jgi:hypothetical protein
MKIKLFKKSIVASMLIAMVIVFTAGVAFADVLPNMGNLTGGATAKTVTDVVDSWITNLRIIGIGLILIPIAINGVMLGFSMGNAQRRQIATGGLIFAGIGVIILVKLDTLAGWIAHQ